MKKEPIPLFWWSEPRLMRKSHENYGDLLSKYIVEKISGRKVRWVHPKKIPWFKINKKNYLATGSIIHHAIKNSIVWGSGIIDHKQAIASAEIRAVRGPRTREYLGKQGVSCPEVYGDPALLLPNLYHPKVSKSYKIGIIAHYNDYRLVEKMFRKNKGILVINLMTMDVESVTREILSCQKIISSSLHGIIVSHAYHIPAIWVEFSKNIFGDGIKYRDYLESIGLAFYEPPYLESCIDIEDMEKMIAELPNSPNPQKITEVQDGLMEVCPFKRQ